MYLKMNIFFHRPTRFFLPPARQDHGRGQPPGQHLQAADPLGPRDPDGGPPRAARRARQARRVGGHQGRDQVPELEELKNVYKLSGLFHSFFVVRSKPGVF